VTKKQPSYVFLKIDIPAEKMAELDESLAEYTWRSRAAFFREIVDLWLRAWREEKGRK
jgi:hypothetical protein